MLSSRTRSLALLTGLALSAQLLGCTPPAPTQLVIILRTDMLIPSELDEVRVQVFDLAGEERDAHTFTLGPGEDQLPGSFGIAPLNGDVSRLVHLRVSARVRGAERFTVEVRTGFIEGQILKLDLVLARLCVELASTCRSDQRCSPDGCVQIAVDQRLLPSFELGDERDDAGMDAGSMSDAARDFDSAVEIDASAAMGHGLVSAESPAGSNLDSFEFGAEFRSVAPDLCTHTSYEGDGASPMSCQLTRCPFASSAPDVGPIHLTGPLQDLALVPMPDGSYSNRLGISRLWNAGQSIHVLGRGNTVPGFEVDLTGPSSSDTCPLPASFMRDDVLTLCWRGMSSTRVFLIVEQDTTDQHLYLECEFLSPMPNTPTGALTEFDPTRNATMRIVAREEEVLLVGGWLITVRLQSVVGSDGGGQAFSVVDVQ